MGGRQDRASKGPTDRQNWAGKGDEGGIMQPVVWESETSMLRSTKKRAEWTQWSA